ncbi:MAG TPA: MATE family efflux transporter [Gammaproteobacteria bacterium]|nr:MATE family efflux transporter [Gammaproteobacteria bacterium]|tara:strand:+ start:606 stop:1943 length:1338 start_codon:yes stop_codon:yes gene_type:complete
MRDPESITYRYLISKAWPIILANAAVPLLGLVDTAVIGNIGSVEDLGAIAFGALIFSFVYWSFGFLRMGTTGFTAQAAGAGDEIEVRAVLGRALLMAVGLGTLLILLQWPIRLIAFLLLDGTDAVEILASDYFRIRIWGAPATLTNFALMGLLIGLGLGKSVLLVQLFLNGLNILLDVWFAAVLKLGVAGIALGTVVAEWLTVALAGYLIFRKLQQNKIPNESFWPKARVLDKPMLMKTLSANADIMIRTLLLVFSFAFFVNQSARFGDVLLAANHILLQLISFAAFFLDGYAFVVEALTGTAIGAGQLVRFDLAVRRTSTLALVTAIGLAILTWVWGHLAVGLLTDITEVRSAAADMLFFAALYIACSFAAFQLDGVFIGASFTREMRNAATLSLLVFLLVWWLLERALGINGLWWAMIIYVVARAGALLMYFPSLRNSIASVN